MFVTTCCARNNVDGGAGIMVCCHSAIEHSAIKHGLHTTLINYLSCEDASNCMAKIVQIDLVLGVGV